MGSPAAARPFATAMAQTNWDDLTAKIPSDAGKREMLGLKKQIEDLREALNKTSGVRPAWRCSARLARAPGVGAR